MARMRLIGTTLDDGYRDDLNFNFGLLEALIGESNGLTEALRQEMLEKIYNLQTQIDMLTGENIGELLARLNDAIQQALTAAKELAIASATLADEKAAYAEGKAILAQEAADNANQEATNLGQMKVAVVQATQDANTATSIANQATEEAQTATNAINAVLPNVTGLENLKEWSSTIAYKKNNFVTFEGNGYMALQNNINISPPSFPTLSNDDWAMLVQKGEKGEQGTGVRILGTLVNESELPSIGEPGDAYLINGDLYVWSDTTDDWTNVGTIKGPKGDQGIQGPKGDKGDKGDPGEDADVEAINQQIDTLRTEVTEQLEQMKPKVDNSWQKGVYNNTDVTNLGDGNYSRFLTVQPNEWTSTTNVEVLYIVVPITDSSGVIKLTLSSASSATDSAGGATVEYVYQAWDGQIFFQNKTITSISEKFAKNYFISNMEASPSSKELLLPIMKAPNASNYLGIKLEIQSKTASINTVKGVRKSIESTGSPTALGYPWTPQSSQIPTYDAIGRWDDVTRRYSAKSFYMSDINQCINNGEYFINEPYSANMPYKAYWYVTVMAHTDLHLVQTARNVLTGEVYERQTFGSGWNEWAEITPRKLFQSVSNGKAQVASAITGKGVQTASDATFSQMANNINAIPTSPNVVKGSFTVPAMSPGQTVSVDTASFAITPNNAYCSVVGTVRINGNNIGTILSGVVYCANIGVMGTFGNQYLQFVIINNTSQYYNATTQNYVITQ
ncbi:hypothetical protein ABFY60_15525 [Lysinibacillus pakistanensis]|uniref:hypothetical protein n=1 Tax=Lysinibacillus pakistanensis TaxID=759811 RepID=UPI003D2B1621